MPLGFWARCHHDTCSGIVYRPFTNIKLQFFVFQIADDISNVYAKKLPMKSQRKAINDSFHRRRQYEQLEGQEGGNSLLQK